MRARPVRPVRPALAAGAVVALALPLLTTVGGGGAAAATCDPFTTPAVYDPAVPTARSVLGFDLGQREVTTAESDRYLRAVDAASPLVAGSVLGTSHQGRSLSYAVVGTPARVADAKAAATTLRDPATSPALALGDRRLRPRDPLGRGQRARRGGERDGRVPAGALHRHPAARTHRAAAQIRDNAVVAILPTQNPDGRELDTRRNAYGFDMNRDWFARTQPETDGKLEARGSTRRCCSSTPTRLGNKDNFFLPNADPIYHEITDESVSWINDTYGAAMQDEFDRQNIPYFNYAFYDMFYMGYGDTVPKTGFLGAGMTFEKDSYDGNGKRVYEQYVAIWTSLSAAATRKTRILEGWARPSARRAAGIRPARSRRTKSSSRTTRSRRGARHEGPALLPPCRRPRAGGRGAGVGPPAAADGCDGAAADGTARGARLHAVLRSPTSATLPAGTYWVPMAQAQKHWVQAMLHEDTYTRSPTSTTSRRGASRCSSTWPVAGRGFRSPPCPAAVAAPGARAGRC